MGISEIIDEGMKLPHTTMRSPYGPDTLCLEICGKQFALFDLSAEWDFYNVKSVPELSFRLRDRHITINPAFHMNKTHWNSVDIHSFPIHVHAAILRHAYMQTLKGLPKKTRIALFGSFEEFEHQYSASILRLESILL